MFKLINLIKRTFPLGIFRGGSGIKRNLVILMVALPLAHAMAQVSTVRVPDTARNNTIAFDGRDLSINQDAFLSQHDIVFLSPAVEGYEGLPIGNGDLGAMGWTPPDKLFFQINKTNTWDDAPSGMFSPWEDNKNPEKSERFTSLRSCGQLQIEPGLPAFDWMYLKDFEGRLSLSDAQASWYADGPNGKVRCSSFVAKDPSVMVVHYEDSLSEAVDRRVTLARWGSRVFEHWYRYIRRDSFFGNGETKAGYEGDEIWIEQSTRSLKFAMAVKMVGPGFVSKRLNSHEAGYVMNPGKSCSFDLYLSVVTSEEADDPLEKARENIRKASDATKEKIYEKHKERWAQFWSKSFIDLPDDYLENLWYINLYQIGSSSLGQYPPHFIGSLWSWNKDVLPWGHYYQWNEQSYTWPLHTSGHPELMMPYAKWKLEGLGKAVEAAKLAHGVDGAFYSDVSDRSGNQGAKDRSIIVNLSSTGYTAMDLWRHYQYTLDRKYLEQYAYPVMREVVRFYTNKLEKRNDGYYHLPEAVPNESPMDRLCSNTTNDLAAIRNLFPAFIQAARELKQDKTMSMKVEEIIGHLAPYVFTKVPKDAKTWGPVRPGDTLIAYGRRLETGLPGDPWSTRPYFLDNAPMDVPSSAHVINAQLTPVFPANLVTLDDKGTPLFEGLQNAALSFDPVSVTGHGTTPICLARLGLTKYLPDVLDRWVDQYQIFSQGLFCYWQRDYIEALQQRKFDDQYSASEHKVSGLTNNVEVLFSKEKERVDVLRKPFAHMALEAGSILETTLDEMLLQSHQGKIRVFPAVPDDWASRFKLHAQGGFVVTSERAEGEVSYVAIKSMQGQSCTLANPWATGEKVRVRLANSNRTIVEVTDGSDLRFKTERGRIYVVERLAKPVYSFQKTTIGGARNTASKAKGRARIGLARQF